MVQATEQWNPTRLGNCIMDQHSPVIQLCAFGFEVNVANITQKTYIVFVQFAIVIII